MPFAATWMQLERIILSEVRKRMTNNTRYHVHAEPKLRHKGTYLWHRNKTQGQNRLGAADGLGEVEREAGSAGSTITWRTGKPQGPAEQHADSKCPVINHSTKDTLRRMYMYSCESFCCKAVINILNLYFNLKNKAKKKKVRLAKEILKRKINERALYTSHVLPSPLPRLPHFKPQQPRRCVTDTESVSASVERNSSTQKPPPPLTTAMKPPTW